MVKTQTSNETQTPSQRPSAWVERFAPLVKKGGSVLDLACGAGRHARLFLARGHPVTALDRDLSGISDLAGTAGLALVAADLEDGSPWPVAGRRFAGIVVANYLYRPILEHITDSLEPDGVLIYETFAAGNEAFGRPRNPAYLLAPGELLDAVRGRLRIVAYECGAFGEPRPAVVQRICAINAPASAAPPRLP